MKNLFQIALILMFVNFSVAQVGINTTNPDASAELDVSSTNKGLLIPRLTTAAITTLSATAAEGLLVFDIDRKLFLGWDGTKWQVLGNIEQSIVFAGWEVGTLPGGNNNYGPSPFNATTTNQISAASFVRGTGLTTTGTAAASAWGGNAFNQADLAGAITDGDFFTASLTLPSGYLFSFSKISAHIIRRSTNGPQSAQWQYSVNGGAYTNIGSAINLSVNGDNTIPVITLSSIGALQNLNNMVVAFRLVGYNGTGGTGYINNANIGNDFEIIGTYN